MLMRNIFGHLLHIFLHCSQVYLPCALIVVLSWVGFWLNREATSDRVTLGRYLHNYQHKYPYLLSQCNDEAIISGVTAVLTLSAISMDSRSDLPKVHYATALDWFIICSFLYCIASILEFAGVHYFTKVCYIDYSFISDTFLRSIVGNHLAMMVLSLTSL